MRGVASRAYNQNTGLPHRARRLFWGGECVCVWVNVSVCGMVGVMYVCDCNVWLVQLVCGV